MFFAPDEKENQNSMNPTPADQPEQGNEWSSRDNSPSQDENKEPAATPAAEDAGNETEHQEKNDSADTSQQDNPDQPPVQNQNPYQYQQPNNQYQPPWQQASNQNPYSPNPYYNNNGGYQPQPQKPGKPPLSNGSKVFIGCMIALAALVLFGAVGFIGWSFLGNQLTTDEPGLSSQVTQSQPSNTGISLEQLISLEKTEGPTLSTIDVAAKIRPSVVTITVYELSSVDPIGEGSGIVFTKDGYIITNQHVVADGNRIVVTLYDNKQYEATVFASSSSDDIAILKVDASNLTPAEFGDSDKLQIGQFVMTSGNPGGSQFAGSVTFGLVSGTKRVSSASSYTTYIQTDAAINPGNSGGPLVNMSGQVVGINSAKIADVDYEGIGFAIPSNEAAKIINDLLQYKYVKGRVKIGITIQDIDAAVRVANKLPSGVQVMSVSVSSEAAKAGLAQGDIITKLNGRTVETTDQLISMVREHNAGDKITLSVYRMQRGQVSTFEITVTLMEDRGDLG